MRCWLLAGVAAVIGCRGTPPDVREGTQVAALVDSLKPAVERAIGLRYTHTPRSAIRSREQVRSYIIEKLDESLPPEKAKGLQATYRLLGVFPDTVELRPLLLDLFTEQIIGFYEPDSSTLFVVAGADPAQRRIVVAHEMVHALQHQYTPIDSIMKQQGDNDRLMAAQAIFEGQATIGGLQVVVPEQNLTAMPEFWETYRETLKSQQSKMPVFSRAPRVVREEIIFPYLAGADFMRWWAGSEFRDSMPFGRLMPSSTEQILHPYRYGRGDGPITLRFTSPAEGVLFEDVLGELDLDIVAAEVRGDAEVVTVQAVGWGGDRYRVYDTPDGPALVWYTVWDDAASRARFLAGTASRLEGKRRLGYRRVVTSLTLGSHPATRVVIAPERWAGWKSLPEVEVIEK